MLTPYILTASSIKKILFFLSSTKGNIPAIIWNLLCITLFATAEMSSGRYIPVSSNKSSSEISTAPLKSDGLIHQGILLFTQSTTRAFPSFIFKTLRISSSFLNIPVLYTSFFCINHQPPIFHAMSQPVIP